MFDPGPHCDALIEEWRLDSILGGGVHRKCDARKTRLAPHQCPAY